MSESTALQLRESWGGAAERGLQARQERESIVSQVLRGESEPGKADGDYGIIPGTKKPTLLKPGAEKIADSLNLYPDYEPMKVVEDFDRPLFHYSYRCILRARGSDAKVATGIGSCNSMEARYRWRQSNRVCPQCGQETIFKSKQDDGGWYCWAKKGGCGAKYDDRDPKILGQKQGQVPNDDVFSLVNTIDKMAQKRAMVAAALNLGFSEQFTQAMEDIAPSHEEPPPVHVDPSPRAAAPNLAQAHGDGKISTNHPDFTLAFTKEKGKRISQVDMGLLDWLIKKFDEDSKNPDQANFKIGNVSKLNACLLEKQRRAKEAPAADELPARLIDEEGDGYKPFD